jgi:phosphate-selective porin OprO/OprP
VEAAWVLTGERRDYSTRRGVFGNVYPATPLGAGGAGAFELAARGSVTDLRYDVRYHGPTGDYGEVGSVGVNWYPNDALKAMLDFVQIRRTSHGSVGDSDGDPANPSREDWIVQARLQWYFVVP